MNLRRRLVLTLVALIALMAAPAIYASSRLLQLQRVFTEALSDRGESYLAYGELNTRLAEYDQLQRSYISNKDPRDGLAADSALSDAAGHLHTLILHGYTTEDGVTARVVRQIQEHSAAIGALMQEGSGLLEEEDSAAATAKFEAAATRFEPVKPLLQEATNRLDQISDDIENRTNSEMRRAALMSAAGSFSTLVALAVAIFLAIGLAAWITRNLVRPITHLRRAMARVTGGDLRAAGDLPYDRPDEIGDVSRSFRSMTGRLAELDMLRAEFMSISTHELKTPINVISGYAELMHEGVLGEVNQKQVEALESIREQARVLTQMVNQLLDVSRIEAGGLQLEISEVQLEDILGRVHRAFQALARRQRVDFTVELLPDAPRVIPGDVDRLRDQVLGNLLSNAFKFTPAGGRITVRARADGDWLLVEVEDTGPGIPAEQLPHIFDKFYQVGEQARSQGTGLGLTIAHEVVSEHGGSITVDSSPGQGTRFHIRLPASREQVDLDPSGNRLKPEDSLVAGQA